MWSAQFVSNIGNWMETVGAQWLMLSFTTSALYISLVQTAASLPIVLFAILAGTIGDLVDRRRFLIAAQSMMLLAAAALGVLAIAGALAPWSLLALLFVVGTGQALTAPTWQTLQPELVAEGERTQAISLGSVNQNLARAVGPAIGGALLAATSAGVLFLCNAASFAAVIVVIAMWHSTRPPARLPREHVGAAIRAGGRYVMASPSLIAILVRAAIFVFFASSLWALLPLVAHSRLHLGSGGYGLLLGCVGAGAVAGAFVLPRLRVRFGPGALLSLASVVLAGVALCLAYVPVPILVGVVLVVAGSAWILALSTLNSVYQLSLPRWVKARGMAFYLMVYQGGNAVGSAVLGVIANQVGVATTLAIAAAGLVLGILAALRFRFVTVAPEDLRPAGDWPAPHLFDDLDPDGPVLVTVAYQARSGCVPDLVRALRRLRYGRRRTGATSWRVWQDGSDPNRVLEEFVVASWDEHQRQHERLTTRDERRISALRDYTVSGAEPAVTHWITPQIRVE